MKNRLLLLSLVSAAMLAGLPAAAGQRYHAHLSAVFRTTNQFGALISVPLSGNLILRFAALNREVPVQPKSLALVYDREEQRLLIVRRADGNVESELFQLHDILSIANDTGTRRERHMRISDSGNEESGGSLVGTEKTPRTGEGEEVRFRFDGNIQLSTPADDNSGPRIYVGKLLTQKPFVPSDPAPEE